MSRTSNFFALAVAVLALDVPILRAQEITDKERRFQAGEMVQNCEAAYAGVQERVRSASAGLREKQEKVRRLAHAPSADKQQLVAALRELMAAYDLALKNWTEECVTPVWATEDTVARAISNLRATPAEQSTISPASEKARQLQLRIDRELASLAQAFKSETDPQRKRRLATSFQALQRLRSDARRVAGLDPAPARIQVQGHLLSVLGNLELRLVKAAFSLETSALLLAAQRDEVALHVEVLSALDDADRVARMTTKLFGGKEDLSAMPPVIEEALNQGGALQQELDGFLGQAAAEAEGESTPLDPASASSAAAPPTIDPELAREIERCAASAQPLAPKVPAQPVGPTMPAPPAPLMPSAPSNPASKQ
ncbi:MAG: hypothetical protein HYZ53_30295 [Planctomycetes bacterium]|nr:hypothetical protein [Planctomycetota bacterium]